MLFNSYVFLLGFLPLALGGFFLAARAGRRTAALWLIVCSFVFYGWSNPAWCPLLAISILFNQAISWLLARAENRPRFHALLLVLGVSANLLALIWFKYVTSLIGFANDTLSLNLPDPGTVLPVGISFFTFTQIGYLIDRAAGVTDDRDPLNYALFVTFFPHLIAGPIVHHREIMTQFAAPATWRPHAGNLCVGAGIFIIGLLKKGLLADPAGVGVAAAFEHPEALGVFDAWRMALSYSLQLYFDFSGYSDMAIGLARMFNVTFPANFNSPYKARSVIDYWQRWHMTLTRYLTQYVYTPLALAVMRARRSRRLPIGRDAQRTVPGFAIMIALPILVTMTLAGVWHGAGAQFLVFGLLHAGYLCVNHAWRVMFGAPTEDGGGSVTNLAKVALTYFCVLIAAVFFRAPSVGHATTFLGGMVGLHGLGAGFPVDPSLLEGVGVFATLARWGLLTAGADEWARAMAMVNLVWFMMMYTIVWALPNTQQIFIHYAPVLERVVRFEGVNLRFRVSLPWALAMGFGGMLGFLSLGGSSEFLYFRF